VRGALERRRRSDDEVVRRADTVRGREEEGERKGNTLTHENGCASGTLTLTFPFHAISPSCNPRNATEATRNCKRNDGRNKPRPALATPSLLSSPRPKILHRDKLAMTTTTLGASSSQNTHRAEDHSDDDGHIQTLRKGEG
jgi:hypothetical protein